MERILLFFATIGISVVFSIIATFLISMIPIEKHENTDVNHDGITDIRDLAIVQKKIIEQTKEEVVDSE